MILSSPTALAAKPRRIVSLVPSQTELLHYLGLEKETAGITKFCVHPAHWFRNKTRVGGTKAIDIEKIISLQPDLVIANKEENVKDQVEALAAHFPVWVSDVNDLPDALQMIGDIGRLTGTADAAERLVTAIRQRFEEWIPAAEPARVAYLIWKDPYMTAGGDTFISSMLEAAGYQNAFAHLSRYPEISARQILAMNCRLVFLSSEPYPFSEKHIAALAAQLPGVKICLVDGEMFSWYGSRLVEAAAYFKSLSSQLAAE
jgi:ABC-type Fe3+-hydroxamate transport system substrate-binding protein